MELLLSYSDGLLTILRNRALRVILLTAVVLVLSGSVMADDVTRILPLGDSITRGWYGSAPGFKWGYRKPLYDLLINDGYSFDFVGGSVDGVFPDPQHEGHDGWHANSILAYLPGWLNTQHPDVILLHIGTNDITGGDQNPEEVNGILNVIDAYEINNNTHVTVILALIIDRWPRSSLTTTFNNQVNAMALNRIANGDDIIIVDMENAINYPADMDDSLHPNDAGYTKMAQVWYNALAGCDCINKVSVKIAGQVLEADSNTPVEGLLVKTENNDINAVTDADGFYELSVENGWSGVVMPQKEGCDFEPNCYVFTDVNQDCTDVNYTAVPKTFKIMGFVLDTNGVTPVSDVNISAENGGGPWTSKYGGGATLTDANGYYEIWVDYNWSGEVKPMKYNYVLEPNAGSYTDVNHDYTAQNYMGNELTIRITGYIKNGCNAPIEGVLVDADNGGGEDITDSTGFCEVWVVEGWSGTITPNKANYTFEPGGMSYTSVFADVADQNYAADNVYDLDCDGSVGAGDIDIIAKNWLLTGTGIAGDFIADGRIDFLDFAKFTTAWDNQ